MQALRNPENFTRPVVCCFELAMKRWSCIVNHTVETPVGKGAKVLTAKVYVSKKPL
jgi:hypothetical protein